MAWTMRLSSFVGRQIHLLPCKRWAIETYFRTMKGKLSLDHYQIRNTRALDRYWIIALFTAVFCIHTGEGLLIRGLEQWKQLQTIRGIEYVFIQARAGISLKEIKKQLQGA
ncbi:hypothetical protein EEL31_01765 [Brevibacillus laterosporus]|nr:transposase [Brevibacillus laterosporus]TPG73130.1 hypothetical protein EEL31_01765 [Brevibacillus laterosporus]